MKQNKVQQRNYSNGDKNTVNYQYDDEWGKTEDSIYAKKKHQSHRIRNKRQNQFEQPETQFIENTFVQQHQYKV